MRLEVAPEVWHASVEPPVLAIAVGEWAVEVGPVEEIVASQHPLDLVRDVILCLQVTRSRRVLFVGLLAE